MPLIALPGDRAVANYKTNPFVGWPQRGAPGRLEPIARPKINAGFELTPGERVFTIGSCFARNIERVLQERGLEVPVIRLVRDDPEFREQGTGVLNNYGTPSIHNEIAWAFGDAPDEAQLFAEIDGKWIDLHLNDALRPASLDIVRRRRRFVGEAYRCIASCRTIVITLGLAECWYDRAHGVYLNKPPLRSLMRRAEGRFELHVLSYEEVYAHLHAALRLIAAHGAPGVRVILTVSPVPLVITYRDVDVMEANSYSKAVLRTAAEAARHAFDFVDYFPSFESVTLSDRAVAWRDDNVHVTDEIVRVNVDRMISAYMPAAEKDLDQLHRLIEAHGGAPARLFALIKGSEQHLDDPVFAEAYAAGALAANDAAAAIRAVDVGRVSPLTAARVATEAGDPQRALDLLAGAGGGRRLYWSAMMKAQLALDDIDGAVRTGNDWLAQDERDWRPYRLLAMHLAARDDPRADRYFTLAIERDPPPAFRLDYAEHLARTGRAAEARGIAEGIDGGSFAQQRRLQRLTDSL